MAIRWVLLDIYICFQIIYIISFIMCYYNNNMVINNSDIYTQTNNVKYK